MSADQQSEGRPGHEAKKKINYGIFNEVGQTDLDLELNDDMDSEVELNRSKNCGVVLVRETC